MFKANSIRTTVSVPEELYAALPKAAKSSHLATACVIRDGLWLYLRKQGRAAAASESVLGGARLAGKKAKSA